MIAAIRRRSLLAGLTLPASRAFAQAPAETWFDRLMRALAAIPAREASFTLEKRIAALTTPLVSHGRLIYRRPDHLEQITTGPQPETLVVDGDRLTIAAPGQGTRTLSLADQPLIAALVDGVRAALAGDVPGLQRYYRIEAGGGLASWTVQLTPATAALARTLRSVTLSGAGTDIRSIVTLQANGDAQSMTISA